MWMKTTATGEARLWDLRHGFAGILALLVLAGCAGPSPEEARRRAAMAVDDERLQRAADDSGNWLSHGQTYAEQRFSRLALIAADNVHELGLAWAYHTGLRGGIETTPLVVDGTMYLTGPWSIVYALDARTGQLLWRWDPDVPRLHGLKACCDVVNRGVALYRGKVYVGTLDGRLAALDAATGAPVWTVATVDPDADYTITGAPRIVQGNVIIGNGGAEYGVRGYVSAYDAETGELAWRTYTVPGDPSLPFESKALEIAAQTWSGEWWQAGGGGTAWDAMAYDPELGLLYIGTGNGSPWSRHLRSPGGGDNLYLSSILALDPADGELVWHFQTTPGDHWDYTATQSLILADLEIGGRHREVIMQAPKNGFFYVLDRRTGEFLSAEAYVPLNWAEGIDPDTGRPIERPGAVYGATPVEVQPIWLGGHNWQPMAFNPDTGYAYIPVFESAGRFAARPGDMVSIAGPGSVEERGALLAWNPVTQSEAWRLPLAHWWNGGVLTTAGGLVFHGGGDGRFVAYGAQTGDMLWDISTGLGIIGSPVSYLIDDVQYVTVAAGWGGVGGRTGAPAGAAAGYEQFGWILTFRLGGTAPMPRLTARAPVTGAPTVAFDATADTIAQGKELYRENCIDCHGRGAVSRGAMPNLQAATQAIHDAFTEIVLEGALEARGMPAFSGRLTKKEAQAVQAYIVSAAGKPED